MGMYTELVLKCCIKNDIPTDVHNILKLLFSDECIEIPTSLPDHIFFKKQRWDSIGRSNSYYHIPNCLNFYDEGYLFTRSDLKDYDDEIESFLDWIDPYIDEETNKFIGWVWYEEWDEPMHIYKKSY